MPHTNNSEDKLYNSMRTACVHRLGNNPPKIIHAIRANTLSTSSLVKIRSIGRATRAPKKLEQRTKVAARSKGDRDAIKPVTKI